MPSDIYFQMTKNTALNAADFANMMSPVNPNGDQRTAEAFSGLVDILPGPGQLWSDSTKRLSQTVIDVLAQANTDNKVDPAQLETYQEAHAYLNTTVTTEDFHHNKKKKTQPSDVALAYDQARTSYITAITGYRTAYNGYDLDKVEDQRKWNAVAPMLQNNVDQTWNAWGRADKAEVEEAQQALASTINDAVSHAIAEQQELVSAQYRLPSSAPGGHPWIPSYALPSNWDSSGQGITLTLSSANLNETASTSAQSYGAEVSGSYGLFHASGGVSGEHDESHSHMDAQNFTLSADLSAVQILRPWFNPLLLGLSGWWVKGLAEGGLSNGDHSAPAGLMPLIPTGFVVARNVSVSADFSTKDQDFIKNAISTNVSAGWGPFSISGNYSQPLRTRR